MTSITRQRALCQVIPDDHVEKSLAMLSFPSFTCVSVPCPATRRRAALPWPQFGLPAVRADWSAGTTDLPARAATQESFTASGEFICLQGRDTEEGADGKRRSMCTKVNIHNARSCPSASSVRYCWGGGGGYREKCLGFCTRSFPFCLRCGKMFEISVFISFLPEDHRTYRSHQVIRSALPFVVAFCRLFWRPGMFGRR